MNTNTNFLAALPQWRRNDTYPTAVLVFSGDQAMPTYTTTDLIPIYAYKVELSAILPQFSIYDDVGAYEVEP